MATRILNENFQSDIFPSPEDFNWAEYYEEERTPAETVPPPANIDEGTLTLTFDIEADIDVTMYTLPK